MVDFAPMTKQFMRTGPTISVGQRRQVGDWIVLGAVNPKTQNVHNHSDLTSGMSQTKVNNSGIRV